MAKTVPEIIEPGVAYSLREFRLRANVSESLLVELRKKGLRTLAIGQKRYIMGDDWITFLKDQNSKHPFGNRSMGELIAISRSAQAQ